MIAYQRHVYIVTGLSGAGRTTALKALEDIGCEVVDNLPLFLLDLILTHSSTALPLHCSVRSDFPQILALGIDARTRDFDGQKLLSTLKKVVIDNPTTAISILYFDCELDVLQCRFMATRRVHPLAQDRPVIDGLLQERHLLSPLREQADLILDTTHLTPGQLRHRITDHLFGKTDKIPHHLKIHVTSFSYKKGVPRDADLVFDVRFLQNPHYSSDLRPLTGQDKAVGAYIQQDPVYHDFATRLQNLLALLLPRYQYEGKSYLTISFGCTGGRHRYIFMAETFAKWLITEGWYVIVSHRDTTTFGVLNNGST